MENGDYEIVPNEDNKALILLKSNKRLVLLYEEFIDKKLFIHGYSKFLFKKILFLIFVDKIKKR